ncbi:3649_t:CDS:2 [Gigaspora margarita]|uniref:3649_t:CDS:1 n=1 Tax=Gigaspora margarita TaxID=4874 RepID=A0ABM8W352_GIGMA|nr:3649_t:CDS:2 [Gigaspora margarita]
MIPRQSKQISFCDEFTQTLEKVPAPGKIVLAINRINIILVFITLTLFIIFDSEAENILRSNSNQNENMTMLYGKFGYDKFGAANSIPPTYPYLKDQIIGPDYRIIQCDRIDSLSSWQDQWCTYHQHLFLCKRSYRISKLWVVYQYQYRKGLFLKWLKNQIRKSRQHIEPETTKNVKSDMVNKEINKVEVVIIR